MPRRREVTVEGLDFAWDADGGVASTRSTARPRPMAHELGQVLLALVAAAESAAPAFGPTGGVPPSGVPATPTTTQVARLANISERDARAALRELLPTGCVIHRRVRLARQRECARWAHGFQLVPDREARGPGRRPRLNQLALLVEPSVACGDLLDVLFRHVGVLAAQVVTGDDAHRLLRHIGFEYVVADGEAAGERPGLAALIQASRAAGCGPILLLVRSDAHAPDADKSLSRNGRTVPGHGASAGSGSFPEYGTQLGRVTERLATMRKPFTPDAIGAVIQRMVVGGVLSLGDWGDHPARRIEA